MDLGFIYNKAGLKDFKSEITNLLINCGTHPYIGSWKFARGQTVIIENLNYEQGSSEKEDPQQYLIE